MKTQKTVAKWLALVLLVTVVVGSYFLYDALSKSSTVSGAASVIADVEHENSVIDDGATEKETPKVSSPLPRSARKFGTVLAHHVGGSGDDTYLGFAYFAQKYFVLIGTSSDDYDLSGQSTLALCAFSKDELLFCKPVGKDETFLDIKADGKGVNVLSTTANNAYLRRYDSNGEMIAEAQTDALYDAKLYLDGSSLLFFARNQKGVQKYDISSSYVIEKSSFICPSSPQSICEVLPLNGTYLIITKTADKSTKLFTYTANKGFNLVKSFDKLDFFQIVCFQINNSPRLLLNGTEEGVNTVYLVDASLNTLAEKRFESDGAMCFAASGDYIYSLSSNSVVTYCKHLDVLKRYEHSNEFSAALSSMCSNGVFSVAVRNKSDVKLLQTDLTSMATRCRFAYSADDARADLLTSCDNALAGLFFTSSSSAAFGGINFGGSDCFFVLDENAS